MTHGWPPFVILSLPRSRSAWLTAWLGTVSGEPVGHDLAIECDTVNEWLNALVHKVRGTCETGAVEAWPILRAALPQCRVVTVSRDVEHVAASLDRVDAPVDWATLEHRARALRQISECGGVLSVDFRDLRDPRVCARVQEHCLGTAFDWGAWEQMDRANVQIDMGQRLARLRERAPRIAALKQDLAARLATPEPFVTVWEEPWARVADECETLGAGHHAEATEGREGAYRLNRAVVAALDAAGCWRSFIARVDGEIVGYCLWSRSENVEAEELPAMNHGPFYVKPEYKRHGLGKRLLDVSIEALARSGYQTVKLHHTMYGRGARAGRLYERMGAVEHQREYHLRIA